ncbi:MAG: ABC transporter permease subunit [Clostridia bacterium]|nr:ABC transporter permease subunit [Clostridia bacterium]
MNKYLREKIFKVLMVIAVLIVLSSLVIIVGLNIVKGGLVLLKKPGLIVASPGPKYLLGGEGGILHAILGSIYMVIPSTIIAAILGYLVALFLQTDYMKKSFSDKIRVLFDILWGVPSIIYGIFMLSVLIFVNRRGSLLGAIITLTLLQLPIITRYMDEALQTVPNGIRESLYSLGATRIETSLIVTKYALPGIVAGILLGMGRAMGDAASVIFTAGAGNAIPKGLMQSATSLPVLIFLQSNSYYENVREDAYAASFVLIFIIIVLNLVSRLGAGHFTKYTSGGRN